MENNKVILSADDNNENVEFTMENAYELDYVKSLIRDGIVQVKMPIKVKCNHSELSMINKYLTLMKDNESEEDYKKFHNDLFSIENESKMEKFLTLLDVHII